MQKNTPVRRILIGGLLTLLLSCVNRTTDWPEDIRFTLDGITPIQLKAQIIDVSYEYMDAHSFFVFSDTIMVVVNKPREGIPIIQLAHIKTGEELARTLYYGNGPLEVLLPQSVLRDNTLYVDDSARQRVFAVNLNELLKQRSLYRPKLIYEYNMPIGAIAPLDEENLVIANSYCFEDEASGYSNSGQNRLLFYSSSSGLIGENTRGRNYYTFNVTQGELASFSEDNRIFYASLNSPIIEIHDNRGNKIKRMRGPEDLPIVYYNGDGDIMFEGDFAYCYFGLFPMGKSLYLNYIGEFNDRGFENMKSTFMVLDMDGNIQRIYQSPVFVGRFSVTPDGIIYGQGYDQDRTRVMLKLTPHDWPHDCNKNTS